MPQTESASTSASTTVPDTPPLRLEGLQPHVPLADRFRAGKELRSTVPRSAHAGWSPPDNRPDPVSLLQATDRVRLPSLLPIRYGRMLQSPFTFLRGAAAVMAADLAKTPVSGIIAQIAGDAHLGNFGTYGTPERNLVFDVNDFDETLPGPWEWDVKRLAASIVVAGRGNRFDAADCAAAARAAVRTYREHMAQYAQMSHLQVYYARVDAADVLSLVGRGRIRKEVEVELAKARTHDHLQALHKLCTTVDGEMRIKDDPPLVQHVNDPTLGNQAPRLFHEYLNTVQPDRRVLIERYTPVDGALKVVGVGSVGTRCFILLLKGIDGTDPLFLQIKQAMASVLEPYLGKSSYKNHGERVVSGQRIMHAATDIFLGWGRTTQAHYYIRQLRDMKGSVDILSLVPQGLIAYAELCGWALSLSHAHSGDPAQISGYLGTSDIFDKAIASFAASYADQTERDHASLVATHKAGKIIAETGV